MVPEPLKSLARWMHIDRSIATTVAARGWQFLSGPITVWMIARHFTPTGQGFFYGFEGVLATQAFFELGLAGVVVSMAGHESAVMRGDAQGDAEAARQRLASLISGCNRWFAAVAVGFAIFALLLGWYVFGSKPSAGVDWFAPWCVLVPIAAVSLWLTPLVAILEGSGYRERVYRIRLWQAITGTLSVWTALALGWALWAAVVASAVQVVWSLILIRTDARQFFRSLRIEVGRKVTSRIRWRTEVIPLQWRVALQSVAFHVATQLLTLIIFHYHGPIAAGRLGLTMKLLVMLQGIASAWLQTRYPVICGMAADRRVGEIDRLWRGVTWVSSAVLSVGVLGIVLGIQLLRFVWPEMGERFTAPSDALLIGAGMLAIHLVSAEGYYIIAFRRPPLFLASVAGLAVVGLSIWIAGSVYGLSALAVCYGVSTFGVLLPLHTLAFIREHRRIGET